MSEKQSKTAKAPSKMPEFLRKLFVGLKRRPSIIALIVLLLAFFQYSLNLTHISDTTAKIQGPGMGLCGFATMLFSMLSLVCFLNAFPRRKKPVIAMVVLMLLMFALIIFCDVYYSNLIMNALTRTALSRSPAPISRATRLPPPMPNRLDSATFIITSVSVMVVAAIM